MADQGCSVLSTEACDGGDPALSAWVDQVADKFEAAWQAVARPQIAAFLGEATGPRRLALLSELVKLDVAYRRRLGEKCQVGDYLGDFPELNVVSPVEGSVRSAEPALARPTPSVSAVQQAVSPPAQAATHFPQIDGYEILGELGHGGMGVVYKARQIKLNRVVALKMILAGVYAGSQERARFRAEAEAAARLQHPHIVSIYDVGAQDGRLYCAQEYIDGGTLADKLHGTPLPAKGAAELIEILARAAQYAHEHGIVHRDLKPANILLESVVRRPWSVARETAATATDYGLLTTDYGLIPKIADFGLAKRFPMLLGDTGASASGCQTQTGEILGSPSYMAPEQADGRINEVSALADVYGLGAILYECLTGRPPFRGETTLDTLEQVRSQDPVSPSRLQPRLPLDLSTICLKCLQKDALKRYARAVDLADDLRRFLDGRPIAARPVGSAEKLWRWSRRNPRVAGLTASVALLLIAIAAAASIAAVNASERAAAAKLAADEAAGREQDQKRDSLMQQIQLLRQGTHHSGWSDDAWKRVIEAAGIRRDDRLKTQAAATLAGIETTLIKRFNNQAASSVAFDPAGRRLLMGGTCDREGRPTGPAKLWDSATDEVVYSKQLGRGPVAFARDGTPSQLVVRPGVGLLLWDVANEKAVSECAFDSKDAELIRNLHWNDLAMALAADGSLVAAASSPSSGFAREGPGVRAGGGEPGARAPGILAVWDSTSGKRLFQHAVGATALVFSPDHAFLAAGDERGQLTIWSVPDGKQVETMQPTRSTVHCLAFSPDSRSRLLAVGEAGGILTVWDWRRKRPISDCHGSFWDVYAVTFSPDGTTLASGGRNPARLWDVATGRLLLNLGPRPLDFATGLTFSSDGRRLAGSSKVGFAAGEVVVWELDDGQGIRTLRGLQSHISKVCFSPDGKLLAALAHNWQVAIWEMDSGRLKASLEVPQGDTADNAALAFSPDGRSFAFSTLTQGKLWDLDTAQEVRNWNLPPGYQDTLAFHPSGKLLLFRFERRDGKYVCPVRDLLGPELTRPLAEIETFDRQVFAITAPADGSYFVVHGLSGLDESHRLLGVFDGTTGKQLWLVPGFVPELDPRGTVMRFQDSDAKLILVEMPSGRPLKDSLIPKRAGVLSPGARYILAGNQGIVPGQEDSISLFRRGEPSPLVTFVGLHPEILFSPAGSHAAWGNPDGSVSLCDIEQVRARLSRAGLGW